MADASILTTWGIPFVGRETMGLGVFQSAVQFWDEQKNKKAIEDFRVGLVEVGDLRNTSGYILAEGSVDQLRKVVDSEEYKRILIKASHVVPVSVSHNVTGNAVMQSIERVVNVRNELGIK